MQRSCQPYPHNRKHILQTKQCTIVATHIQTQNTFACKTANVHTAVGHLHDRSIIHRDLKPENVLVSSNWNVRLVDFDLAQERPENPVKLAKNPGTPAYMSPEQLQREPVDHRADIFAYGVSVYEILTGQKPFAGPTPADILRKQLNRKAGFQPPRELNPDIPPAVEKTILKALETDPTKRHGLLSVMLHDLRTALYV